MVAVGADVFLWRAVEVIIDGVDGGDNGAVLASFLLPLDASAIDQLHLFVPVVLERPVLIRREPVVVVSVERDAGVGGEPPAAQQVGQNLPARYVPLHLVL